MRGEVSAALKRHALGDSDIMVRNFGAIALGEIGGTEARTILLEEFMTTGLDSTRAFCAMGLAIAGSEDAANELRVGLVKRRIDQDTRAAVILALGLLDEKKAAPTIMKSLRSRGDTSVSRFSAIAMGLLDEQKSLKQIRRVVLGKSRPELKREFGQALGLLGDGKVVDQLGDRLKQRSSTATKESMAAALSGINDSRTLDVLVATAHEVKLKHVPLSAVVRAIGIVGERGDQPVLTPHFRHLNYLLRLQALNEIALI